MNMRELLLGTAILAGLFSSAYANDKEVVSDVARGFSAGDICNLTINTEAAAKYLNDELGNPMITASVLADYVEAAAKAVGIMSSVKEDINCEKVLGMYGPKGVVIPGLLEPK
jgi:hypothetical protein